MKRRLAMLRRWWRTRRSPLGALIYEPLLDGPRVRREKPKVCLDGLWGTTGRRKTHIIVPSTLTQHYTIAVTYCGASIGRGMEKGPPITEPESRDICLVCRGGVDRWGVDYDPNGYLEPAGAST